MIKSITVHPKGATHVQVLSDTTYFLKQVEGVWFFAGLHSRNWIEDQILNNEDNHSFNFAKTLVTKIGEKQVPKYVSAISSYSMPPMGDSFDNQVIF